MKKLRILCVIACLILMFSGCKAYQEHTTDLKAVVGEWVLDSKYVNTRSVVHNEAYLTIKDDYTGTFTEIVKQTTVDEEGNTVYVTEPGDGDPVYVTDTVSNTVKASSGGDGILTLTIGGTATNYRFNVDEAAGNLHMWIDEDGDEVHYVYINREVY